ncbi:MAG: hypothetical protein ACRD2A_25040, partial [Vicinamibacterales bacterium]
IRMSPSNLVNGFPRFQATANNCNTAKSNLLAAYDHLDRWTFRNGEHAKPLEAEFGAKKLFHDLHASRAVTRWAYAIAEQSGSKVWQSKRSSLVDLDARWRALPGL